MREVCGISCGVCARWTGRFGPVGIAGCWRGCASCTDPLVKRLVSVPWGSTMLDQITPWCPGLWLILRPVFTLLGGRGAPCSLFGLSALLVLIHLHHVLVGWCFVGGILRYPNRTGKNSQTHPYLKSKDPLLFQPVM